jgi:hypothetical protein
MNSYQLTENPDVVLRTLDNTSIPRGHRWWDDYVSWCAEGNTPDPLPKPTLAQAAAALTDDVQAWLDDTASQNGYDSIASCISYAGSTIAQWSADAMAASKWRDAVWQACFQWQQSASVNPPATFPTSSQVIAQLPKPEAFGWVTHIPGGIE